MRNRIDITGYDDTNYSKYRISFYVFPADKLNKDLLIQHAIFATEKVLVVFKQYRTQWGPLKHKNVTPKMLYTLWRNIALSHPRYGCVLIPFPTPDVFEIQETFFRIFQFDYPDTKELQRVTAWIIENNK